MSMIKNIHNLSDPNLVKPWLRTIAINTARSAGRRHKVATEAMPIMAASAQRSADLATSGDSQRAGEQGKLALDIAQTLPPEYREPLLLRAVRGLSYRHIADVMDVPMTTIETRIARARRMIRQEMDHLESQTETRQTNPSQSNPDSPIEPRTRTTSEEDES